MGGKNQDELRVASDTGGDDPSVETIIYALCA
jgi:hypothetical protein